MNKNIIALGAVSYFTDMATAMVTPLIPILVVSILHEDIQTLGGIVAIATFISYAFRILFGYLGDRFDITKPFVVFGYLLSAAIKPLFFFAGSWQSVAALQGSERLGKAIRSASKDSLISAYAKKNQSGKTFGFHKMMDIAGELTGALIVFSVLATLGQNEFIIKNIFAFTAIPGLIAVIIVLFFVDDVPSKLKTTYSYHWDPLDSRLLPLMGIYFLFLVFIFSSSFLVVKASAIGFPIATIPLLFVALNLVQTLTSYQFGVVIDKLGEVKIMLLSLSMGVLTQVALYFDFIWLSFIFLGLFTVGSLNAMRSYIAHHSQNQSTVFGIFYAGSAVSSAVGALLIGFIWHRFSSNAAILVSITGTISLYVITSFYQSRFVTR